MIRRDGTRRVRTCDAIAAGVNFIGYTALQSGLGGAARGNFRMLATLGPCLNFAFPHATGTPGLPYTTSFHHWHPETSMLISARAKGLLHHGRKNIGFWVSETTGLSRAWVEASEEFDEVWTASTFCRSVFLGHGIRRPIRVWPHALWRPPCAAERAYVDQLSGFVFLTVYDSHSRISRKNPVGALTAFRLAFPADEPVRLVIKVRNAQPGEADLLRSLAGWDPRVEVVTSNMTEREMNTLMASAHAFVSLHRGEGFGLHIAEAMAAGQVCIISGCGGCLDFATQDRTRWVAVSEVPVEDFYFMNHGGAWWDPDIRHAAAVMRRTWDSYGSSETKLLLSRAAEVTEELSPTRLAARAKEYLEQ